MQSIVPLLGLISAALFALSGAAISHLDLIARRKDRNSGVITKLAKAEDAIRELDSKLDDFLSKPKKPDYVTDVDELKESARRTEEILKDVLIALRAIRREQEKEKADRKQDREQHKAERDEDVVEREKDRRMNIGFGKWSIALSVLGILVGLLTWLLTR